MDYTEKYHLPQWVEEDRIQMTDFNEAMENIEKGLDQVKARLSRRQKRPQQHWEQQ